MALTGAAAWLLVVERATAVSQGLSLRLSTPAWASLWGLCVLLVAATATVAGVAVLLRRRAPRGVGYVFAAFVGATGLGLVGRALIGGAWISQQSWAPAIPLATAIGGAVVGALALRLGLVRGRGPTALFAAGSLGASMADAVVMPGLYPAFHFAAFGLASLGATVVALRSAASMRMRPGPAVALALLVAVGLGVEGWRSMSADTRAQLLLHSPLAREVLRATSDETTSRLRAELADLRGQRGGDDPPAHRVDLGLPPNVNVLVVTVDALRADAVPPLRTGNREFARDGDTPHIDALLGESTVFTRAYAPASFTMRSLPATFASRPAAEPHEAAAGALAAAMRERGRVPLAVATRYFIEEPEGRSILEGFDAVEVHSRTRQDQGITQLLQLVDEAEGRPFFAWLHLMATHEPGFAGRQLTAREGSWPERYRKSLQWTDGQIGQLLAALRARGLDDRTIVVFASDHGEGLGDNGINVHGESVFEEEIHVPLAIHLPGQTGRTVRVPVGLVDLVPTLVDLLGGPPSPRHVGHSLAPLLADPDAAWRRDYFSMSRRDSYALVRGDDKLVYDAKTDTFLRFDLAEDPTEDQDLHREASVADAALRSAFVRHHPELFAAELDDDATRALLRQRLDEVDPTHVDDPLPFLLDLAGRVEDPGIATRVERIFDAGSEPVRALVLAAQLRTRPALGARAASHLAAIASTPAESEFVAALLRYDVSAFAPAEVAARLDAHGSDPVGRDYLRLLARWRKVPAVAVGPAIARAGARADEDARLALAAARGLTHAPGQVPDLAGLAVARLADDDEPMRLAACHALAAVGDGTALTALKQTVQRDGEDVRVRQACLNAAVRAAGEDAVDLVIDQARDRVIAFYALRLLAQLRSKKAIPFLQETVRREQRGRIHAAALQALRLTEREHGP